MTERSEPLTLEETIKAALETWSADERDEWEERAAIMEYDGGLSRKEAEIAAFFSCRKAISRRHAATRD